MGICKFDQFKICPYYNGTLNVLEIYAFIDFNKCITIPLTFGIERKKESLELHAAA